MYLSHHLYRDTVRAVMKASAPEGFEHHRSGTCHQLKRKNLVSLGVFHEINLDGHEKLSSKVLKMGPVGIPIYGAHEKYSGALLCLVCVPNARLAVAIGHVYIDLVKEHQDV